MGLNAWVYSRIYFGGDELLSFEINLSRGNQGRCVLDGGMKAPGPDGFQGVFYHSYWDIIVDDVNGLI